MLNEHMVFLILVLLSNSRSKLPFPVSADWLLKIAGSRNSSPLAELNACMVLAIYGVTVEFADPNLCAVIVLVKRSSHVMAVDLASIELCCYTL